VSTPLPVLLAGLVDDAAVYPPGSTPLHEAIKEHRRHRTAWYGGLIGPLVVPASALRQLPELADPDESLPVGVIGDTGVAGLASALAELGTAVAQPYRLWLRHVEVAVAKRREDPQPGLTALLAVLRGRPELPGYAEIPLTWGLAAALDAIAEARAEGVEVAAKFRTGGLAAELFPTPIELAAVICACRDRQVPFKLTAGLHHAIRHTDPETGFVHHGFLNVLVATVQASAGAEVADVAATLAGTDPVPLIEAARPLLDQDRPLWIAFGSCSVAEPVGDLSRLGLLPGNGR
jgi:hypothetical protein